MRLKPDVAKRILLPEVTEMAQQVNRCRFLLVSYEFNRIKITIKA